MTLIRLRTTKENKLTAEAAESAEETLRKN
jgi:hypothetical protein